MSARTGHPPALAEQLIETHLKAFNSACKRYRVAVALRRQNPLAAPPQNPQALTDRVRDEITDIMDHTEKGST